RRPASHAEIRSAWVRTVPAVGVAARSTRREVRSREHEQSGFGIGVAIVAVARRLFVRGLHVCTRGLVGTGHGSSVARAGRVPGGSLIGVRTLLSALRCEKGAV